MPELGKVGVGFERVAALVSQGGTVVGQGLLLLPDVQVDLLGAAVQHIGISLTVVEGLFIHCLLSFLFLLRFGLERIY